MPISGYSMAQMQDGSPHAQAVANGNANIKAASIRNSAGGSKRRISKKRSRKYRGGAAGIVEESRVHTSNYPTNYSPVNTQQKLLTTSVANDVASKGDVTKGGSKKSKRCKKRNFFSNLFRFTMNKKKTKY